jgi:TPP-dependent indolepyruvate ferredoxin oxidoreductase alpha subunit
MQNTNWPWKAERNRALCNGINACMRKCLCSSLSGNANPLMIDPRICLRIKEHATTKRTMSSQIYFFCKKNYDNESKQLLLTNLEQFGNAIMALSNIDKMVK